MEAQEHPHYLVEKDQLERVCTYIDEFLSDNAHLKDSKPLDRDKVRGKKPQSGLLTQVKVLDLDFDERFQHFRALSDVLRQPFLGRVDWQANSSAKSQTFYVGHAAIDEVDVYDWRDPFVGELFYKLKSTRKRGKVLLKRLFEIDGPEMLTIADEYFVPEAGDDLEQEDFTESLLLRALSQCRGRPGEIVSTFRDDQYRIICEPADQLLVVQGPAGSGKSEVALHRVAYLIYQADAGGAPMDDILIIGPNQLFLDYTADVLPALEPALVEERVRQESIDRWLLDRSDPQLRYEGQDQSLAFLLNENIDDTLKSVHIRNARNKGSLRMATLLERYVNHLQKQVLDIIGPFKCEIPTNDGKTIELVYDHLQIEDFVERALDLPFNHRRRQVEEALLDDAMGSLNDKLPTAIDERWRKSAGATIRRQVKNHFALWQNQVASVSYRRLLRDRDTLGKVGYDVFNRWDLALMVQDAPNGRIPLRFDDLAALAYFKLLLDGVDGQQYDHIVVDEGQDVTPMQFKVLAAHARGKSMTVLGDLNRCICRHHSIAAWEELGYAADLDEAIIWDLRHNIRSTETLTGYTNGILHRAGLESEEPIKPLFRQGNETSEYRASSEKQLIRHINTVVERVQEDGWRSIAIVTKTEARCRSLAQKLDGVGLGDLQLLIDPDETYAGGTVVMPAYLTKGLEFDVVILADADSHVYPADVFHAGLLYLTITRAAHELTICYQGKIAPLLDKTREQVEQVPWVVDDQEPRPLTIEGYANKRGDLIADWCVERLASVNRLDLLDEGVIDEMLLEVTLKSFRKNWLTDEETTLPLVDSSMQEIIRQQVDKMKLFGPDAYPPGLGLTQIAFGLLLHQMKVAGLKIAGEVKTDLEEQLIALASFHEAFDSQAAPIGARGWTTISEINQYVAPEFQGKVAETLNLLVEYGILEQGDGRLRLRHEWIPGLLCLALGRPSDEWDRDLLSQMAEPPDSLGWFSLAREVSHE